MENVLQRLSGIDTGTGLATLAKLLVHSAQLKLAS